MTIGGGKNEMPFSLHQQSHHIPDEGFVISDKNDGLVCAQGLEVTEIETAVVLVQRADFANTEPGPPGIPQSSGGAENGPCRAGFG